MSKVLVYPLQYEAWGFDRLRLTCGTLWGGDCEDTPKRVAETRTTHVCALFAAVIWHMRLYGMPLKPCMLDGNDLPKDYIVVQLWTSGCFENVSSQQFSHTCQSWDQPLGLTGYIKCKSPGSPGAQRVGLVALGVDQTIR